MFDDSCRRCLRLRQRSLCASSRRRRPSLPWVRHGREAWRMVSQRLPMHDDDLDGGFEIEIVQFLRFEIEIEDLKLKLGI